MQHVDALLDRVTEWGAKITTLAGVIYVLAYNAWVLLTTGHIVMPLRPAPIEALICWYIMELAPIVCCPFIWWAWREARQAHPVAS